MHLTIRVHSSFNYDKGECWDMCEGSLMGLYLHLYIVIKKCRLICRLLNYICRLLVVVSAKCCIYTIHLKTMIYCYLQPIRLNAKQCSYNWKFKRMRKLRGVPGIESERQYSLLVKLLTAKVRFHGSAL